ncbi:hypothetical protein DMUE_4787 [Dictyocoela muelleri]|nr:hypothetical protein DMUE_4787 [Dictyocoela muelleri]
MRNKSLNEYKHCVWKTLICTANSNLNHCSYEVYFGKSIFKDYNRQIIIDKSKIRSINNQKIKRYENERNSEGKKIKYNIGDKVFIKNYSQDKVATKWKGPYSVFGISESGNNLSIEMNNKITRVSYKNCR